jgi:hypothetical protein
MSGERGSNGLLHLADDDDGQISVVRVRVDLGESSISTLFLLFRGRTVVQSSLAAASVLQWLV